MEEYSRALDFEQVIINPNLHKLAYVDPTVLIERGSWRVRLMSRGARTRGCIKDEKIGGIPLTRQ